MEREEQLAEIPWEQLADVAGPASWVPDVLRGLYDPEAPIDDCREALQDLAYLGGRYTATAPAVPFIVDAIRDSPVLTPKHREDLLFTLWMCALGIPEERLDWRHQRDLQEKEGPEAVAAWNAVTECQPALHGLLSEPGREIVYSALRVLAWTGDASQPVMDAISSAIYSPDSRDICDGWLAAVVLGQLPPDVDAPPGPTARDPLARYGEAAAALRFAGTAAEPTAAEPTAVDELWRSFDAEPPFDEPGQFLPVAALPALAAEWLLAEVPDHLCGHASALALEKIRRDSYPLGLYLRLNLRHLPRPLSRDGLDDHARDTLADVLPLLAPYAAQGFNLDLEDHGLPGTLDGLASWAGVQPPPAEAAR